jgi:hypothetical protein
MTTNYPDITPILNAKQARRRALAALPWEEKIAIVDLMRKQLRPELWKNTGPRNSDTQIGSDKDPKAI